MEEDIKILEELIEPFREQNRKGKKLILDIKGIKYEHYEAIENLIKKNKELEQENKILKNKQTKIIADSFHEKMAKKFDDNFIPKSKIKEKIEELKGKGTFDAVIVLQELLD